MFLEVARGSISRWPTNLSIPGMKAVHPSAAKIMRQAGAALRLANTIDVEVGGALILPDVAAARCVEMVTGLIVAARSRGLTGHTTFSLYTFAGSGVRRPFFPVAATPDHSAAATPDPDG
jgi:aspartokinase